MKYLVHFKPSDALSDIITSHEELAIPYSGLHATICAFYMDPRKEDEYVNILKSLKTEPFSVKTLEFDYFGGNGDKSLVLCLTKPDELHKLHKQIVKPTRKLVNHPEEFRKVEKKWYNKHYEPHITISKKPYALSPNAIEARHMLGNNFDVEEFHLSRKSSKWEHVDWFPL